MGGCWLILCDAPAFDAVFVKDLVSLTRCAGDVLHVLTDFIEVVLIVLEAADAVFTAFVTHKYFRFSILSICLSQ